MKHRLLLALAPLLSLCLLSSCAAQHPIHPGAANQFDSSTYDALLVTQSVIDSTRADVVAGKFPVSIAANVKSALNRLISTYDIAYAAYLSYHAAAANGTSTAAQSTDLSNKIQDVNNATAALTAAKGGN